MAVRNEFEGCRVDAIAQTGGRRSIAENMTEVGRAAAASHFGPLFQHAIGGVEGDHFRVDWLPVTRPAGTEARSRGPLRMAGNYRYASYGDQTVKKQGEPLARIFIPLT